VSGEEVTTLKPTSAEALKKAGSKLVKCSSGNVYRVRKMPLTVLAVFLGLDLSAKITEQLKDPAQAKKLLEAVETVLPVCMVEPKIGTAVGTIELEDIPSYDQIELFMAIVTFSGYTKERVKEFEKFRDNAAGKGGKESSGSNSQKAQ